MFRPTTVSDYRKTSIALVMQGLLSLFPSLTSFNSAFGHSRATPKMLSQQLHDLEGCGMIHREVIPEKPPKTVYSLTTFGESIIPVIDSMCQWGTDYLDGLDVQPPCCGA